MSVVASAAVLRDPGKPMSIETVKLDNPQPHEVLVRITATGVCHTDIGIQNIMPMPVVLGHEGAGIVEAIGSQITKVTVGDRVVLTFGSCGVCQCCLEGHLAYCDKHIEFQFSGRRIDGSPTIYLGDEILNAAFFQQSSFATYALATERNIVRIERPEVPIELLGPLGCGIQTGAGSVIYSMDVRAGSNLVVFGTGSVGLSAIMAGRLVGCRELIAVDVNDARLDLAKKLGATQIINGSKGEVIEQIRTITGNRGADFSLETSGVQQSFNDAIDCLAMRGTCGIVTIPFQGATFPFSPKSILLGGKRLIGIIQGSSIPEVFIPYLIDLFLQGRFPMDNLVTYYQFADINKAIEDSKSGSVVKPILLM